MRKGAIIAESIERLFTEFKSFPSTDCLLNISYVAEVLLIDPRLPILNDCVEIAASISAKWLEEEVLTELLFSHNDLAYPVAVLVALAACHEGFLPSRTDKIAQLIHNRISLMSELPYLSTSAITAHLYTATITVEGGVISDNILRDMIDKRVLRSRSDEYDITALMHAASLIAYNQTPKARRPHLFSSALLVRALRTGDPNWVALLSYICCDVFPTNKLLLDTARQWLSGFQSENYDLLPAPQKHVLYPEFLDRPDIGLRLRSSIAFIAFLEGHKQ